MVRMARTMTSRLMKGLLEHEAGYRVRGLNPILSSQALVDVWPKVKGISDSANQEQLIRRFVDSLLTQNAGNHSLH